MRRVDAVALALVMVGTACDGGPPSLDPEAGVLTFDAAMLDYDAAGRDGGRRRTDAAAEDAGEDAGGSTDVAFVPDIPLTYVGSLTDTGLEITAFTIYEALIETRFLVAMRNVSPDLHLCALDMRTRFDNADGTEIAIAQGLVETPVHRGVSGTGNLTTCLGPGQLGMQAARLDFLAGYSVEDIAAGRYTVGAINLTDAISSNDIVVTGITSVVNAFGSNELVGQLENRGPRTIRNPSVSIFGVTAIGRPTFEVSDIELVDIPRSGAWSFETGSFHDEPYVSFVAFPDAREP
ncbi:MAG: hypothetical protein AB7S26_35665 [Sandaracinaceae bacterium]